MYSTTPTATIVNSIIMTLRIITSQSVQNIIILTVMCTYTSIVAFLHQAPYMYWQEFYFYYELLVLGMPY